MTDEQTVQSILASLCVRKRLANTIVMSIRGLLVSCSLAAAGVLCFAIGGWPFPALLLLGTVLAGPVLGAIIGLALPVEQLAVARALDGAAGSEDRFASAVQLAGVGRANRVQLLTTDALARIRGTSVAQAVRLRIPREARLLPLPLLVIGATFLFGPAGPAQAEAPTPEVSAQQWADLSEQFRRTIEEFKQDEDDDLVGKLERLAELLESQPEKKQALAELAKLRADIERRREALDMGEGSPREAARKMNRSKELSAAAKALSEGDYAKTAKELQALAGQLSEQSVPMDATGFEAAAADLDALADSLEGDEALREALKRASDAANSMNREELARALERLAEQMRANRDKLEEADRLARARKALDELRQRLGQTRHCPQCNGAGCAACQNPGNGFVNGTRPGDSDKKGGLKPGWGSAQAWEGGQSPPEASKTDLDVAQLLEGPGASDLLSVISPEEDAEAAQVLRDHYAEMVRQAEADLQLESAPLAYREYLRRYFTALGAQLSEEPEDEGDQ